MGAEISEIFWNLSKFGDTVYQVLSEYESTPFWQPKIINIITLRRL